MKFVSCNLHRKVLYPEDRSSPKRHPVMLSMRLMDFLLHCGTMGLGDSLGFVSRKLSGGLILEAHRSSCCVPGRCLQFPPS